MTSIAQEPESSARERARLFALDSYEIVDTPAEAAYDEFAWLATSIIGTPTALVSFVDGKRQWFKSRVGMAVAETARDISFCTHAIGGTEVFVVPDAAKDARFSANPLVSGGPKIRFYAGAPLFDPQGHALGTLCVIDYVPREFGSEQCAALLELSRHLADQLELRRRLTQFARGNAARLNTLGSVRRALENGEFMLNYQPTMDVRTGRIAALEALIRWNCPRRGTIAPAAFIPFLESTGLIVDVGNWVLRQAGRDYRDWLAKGLTAPRISVNISPVQLRHPDFITHLEEALDHDDMGRLPLDIEISEGAVAQDPDLIVRKLRNVQRIGVNVTIDDFGTSASSLRHVAHLPVDTLKIDRTLIAPMTLSADDMGLVSSIISLAHGLNLAVTAAGVETDEQRKLLALLRCDRMQGFYFARPAAKDAMEEILTRDQNDAAAHWAAVLQDLPANADRN